MKLFLASKTVAPESLSNLQKFAGPLNQKTVTYIPSALNGERYGSWKQSGSLKIAQSMCQNLSILELESYTPQNIERAIGKPEILWMGGGMAGYLLYWLRRLDADKVIRNLVSQGTIYVGSSAGSMICGNTQISAEINIDDPEYGASLIPGLGLVDFEIYPHYQDEWFDQIKASWPKGTIYLLKDGEAITIDNGKMTILGESRVITK